MKPTIVQKVLFGLGISSVLACGCATPFRPKGWVCYDIAFGNSQSLEYCAYHTPHAVADVGGRQDFKSGCEWQSDPFLAINK